MGKSAFTLQNHPKYPKKDICKCGEIITQILFKRCFSDKDGKFTGIPLQTMKLGETFVKEAK